MPPLPPHFALSNAESAALNEQRHFIAVDDAAFRLEGAGALACLQGLLTNDVVKLPAHSAAWGAFLTPKGMIVTDAWVTRETDAAWILVPGTMREPVAQLLARTIPPRLARVSDESGTIAVRWLRGTTPPALESATVVRPHESAPFTALALTRDAALTNSELERNGWNAAPSHWADAAKLLIGWPTVGREIDDRTLPQEVRFDELGGVKYDKGCYTGQETVARLHFRGHANRVLRGVSWAPGDGPEDVSVSDGEKAVGTLRTRGLIGDRHLALAVLRREVALGDIVRTGTSEAVVVDLPFDVAESPVA